MNRGLLIATTSALLGIAACTDAEGPPPWAPTPRVRTTPALRQFDSCDALATRLRQNVYDEVAAQFYRYRDGFAWAEDMGSPAPAASDGESGGRQEGVDYSGTNNQEAGVDEADFVKTDGFYIYVLSGKTLQIFGAPEFGELSATGSIDLEGYPHQMLLAGDKLVVFEDVYAYELPQNDPLRAVLSSVNTQWGTYYRQPSLAKVTVLDVSNRAAPRVEKELYLEGYAQSGRKVEDTVRFIAYSYLDIPGLVYYPELPERYYRLPYDSEAAGALYDQAVRTALAQNAQVLAATPLQALVPALYERVDGEVVTHTFTAQDCQNFAISDDGASRGFTSILSLGLFDEQVTFESDHIVTNWSHVYASQSTLIIAEAAHDTWWFWGNEDLDDATNIHRFDIATPGVTTYTGSGRVAGYINGSFNLSEHEGYVRVASTSNLWRGAWGNDARVSESHVFVLAGDAEATELEVVGHVDGIALGERLWSSRFVGEQAFLVTFRNIDPLWTVDLSNPALPQVIGELEVPGVSTYIHPLRTGEASIPDALLTIGFGGDNNGLNWSTTISLFDVSDFSAPAQAATLTLAPESINDGWTYAFSEANYEHKAFQYWAPKKLLAVPLSTYRSFYSSLTGYHDYEYKSVLQLVNVDAATGTLSLYGAIDHSAFYNSDPHTYWGSRDVRRSIFMGDFIYAISDRGITAHNLNDLTQVAEAPLPGTYSYFYGEADSPR